MMGFSLGTSTLVGQALGRNRVNDAVTATKATMHIVLGYIFLLLILFLFLPQPLLELFRPRHLTPEDFAPIIAIGINLLRFVAAYIFFDALYMVCIGVLKGAGDTRFIMCSIGVLSLTIMILPVYIGVEVFGAGLILCLELCHRLCLFLICRFFLALSSGSLEKCAGD